jgi:glycosyltransferase involved in cell wall biosynthesis
MRIGIDARFYGPYGKGLGRYTQKLITHLEKIDQHNEYFILMGQENWDDYQPANPHFKKVLADYRWYTLAEQIGMPRIITRLKLDVMHFTHFNVPLFYRGKFVVTIHDLILTKYPTERATTLGPLLYALKHKGYEVVIKRAIRRAVKIIAVSQYTKQDIINHFHTPAEKIVVTHEAVDPPQKIDAGGAAVLLRLQIRRPYILYVGNVYPHKNAEGLLRAFQSVLRQKPECSLVLVGKEDYFFKRIKQEASNLNLLDHVLFPGYVSDADLPYIYAHAALYVFPSFYEGFGLPALEACSYGIPVVSSNASCLPEILGDAAVYFDPHDTDEMAGAMLRVLDDQGIVSKLKLLGLQRVAQFSWEKMAHETLDLYQQI